MNATSLWKGHRYAYHRDLPTYRKRDSIPDDAREVEVLELKQFYRPGNSRLSTEVVIKIVATGMIKRVKPNTIVDFWDNYEDELHHRKQQKAKQEQERAALRIRQQQEAASREQKVLAILASRGIPGYAVTVTPHTTYIRTADILTLGESVT